jgi:hypothetical protein
MPTVELFPFLAVLVCAMGALILVLMILTRQARNQAARDARAKAVQQRSELKTAKESARWRVEQLKKSQQTTERQLTDARFKLGNVENHFRTLGQQLDGLQKAWNDLDDFGKNGARQRGQQEAELARLKVAIREAEKQVAAAKEAAQQRNRSYAVVPYEGPYGTHRRPIYIECREDAVVLHPEGIILRPTDFDGPMGPDNPLASVLRSIRQYWSQHSAVPLDKAGEPYPLLLVRPDGVVAYYLAREAMNTWGAEFGYELIGADWDLKYPPADAALADVLRDTVSIARLHQQALIAAAPRAQGMTYHEKYRAAPEGGIMREGGLPDDDSLGSASAPTSRPVGGRYGAPRPDAATFSEASGEGPGNAGGSLGSGGGPGGAPGGTGYASGTGGPGAAPGGTGYASGTGGPGAVGTGTGLAGGPGGNGMGGPGGGYPGSTGPTGNNGRVFGPALTFGGGGPGNGGGPPGGTGYAGGTGGQGVPGTGTGLAGGGGLGNGGSGQGGTGFASGTPGQGGNVYASGAPGQGGTVFAIGAPGQGAPGTGTGLAGGTGGSGAGGMGGGYPGSTSPVGDGSGRVFGSAFASVSGPGNGGGGPGGTGYAGGTGGPGAPGTGSGLAGGPGGNGTGGSGGAGGGYPGSTGPAGGGSGSPGGTGGSSGGTGGTAASSPDGSMGTGAAGNGGQASSGNSPGGNPGDPSRSGGGAPEFRMNQPAGDGTATSASSGRSGPAPLEPRQEFGAGQWEPSPQSPRSDDRSDKRADRQRDQRRNDLDDETANKLATQRGVDWGLKKIARGSVAITRPIRVECYADHLTILNDPGIPGGQAIPLRGRTRDGIDPLVSGIWDQVGSWGIAGRGMHWQPMIEVRVMPDGERRFREMKTLMDGSGLEVQRKP